MNALLTLANEYFLSYNASWKGFKHLMLLRACRACFVSYVVSRLSLADGAILPVGITRDEKRGRRVRVREELSERRIEREESERESRRGREEE